MEGLMIFHRYGLLGCVVFLAGFVAFAVQPIGLLRKRKSFDSAMAMALAFWATVCTIVMAGMMNPFLTTPFPALFVGLYLVWDERVLSRSSG
jgi:ABC-type sulfate transport system permease component